MEGFEFGASFRKEEEMAANRQQGSYLTAFLVGFTGFVAGLVLWTGGHTAIGVIVTFASLVGLVYSLFGFRAIKRLEYMDMS